MNSEKKQQRNCRPGGIHCMCCNDYQGKSKHMLNLGKVPCKLTEY